MHAAGPAVPLGRLGVDTLECLCPVVLDAECHRIRQKLFEHLGRLHHPIQAIGFDAAEELLEPQHLLELTRAADRARRHEPSEQHDDHPRQDPCDDAGEGLHAPQAHERTAHHLEGHAEDDAGDDVEKADAVGTLGVEPPVLEHAVKVIPQLRQVLEELVLEARQPHGGLASEHRPDQIALERLQQFTGRRLLQRKGVILAGEQSKEAFVVRLRNVQVAAHGEVDDGRRDVAHIRLTIDERAELGRAHLLRRLVPREDRSERRIAAACAP